jgi:class 3 adenylate cyclase
MELKSSTLFLLDLKDGDAEIVWKLAHSLDLQIQVLQRMGATAPYLMEQLGPWILDQIGASGLGVQLTGYQGTDESIETLFVGTHQTWLQAAMTQGISSFQDQDQCSPEVAPPIQGHPSTGLPTPTVFWTPLLIADDPIGILAAAFTELPPAPGAPILLEVVGQELNNLFYELRRARLRHNQVIEVGKRLMNKVLDEAIDHAISYVLDKTNLTGMVVTYCEDPHPPSSLCIRTYQGSVLIQKCYQGEETPLGQLFNQVAEPSVAMILEMAQLAGDALGPIHIELGFQEPLGRAMVCAATHTKTDITTTSELLEHLASALGRRIADYHKDRRYLQHFFAPQQVSRLLSVGDYQQTYLSPRLQEAAMLYVDINSFTKISECVLETPQEVGELIDHWSKGAVQVIFANGGVFDKMVGDCIIGLFGPPFDELSAAEKIAQAVRSALIINQYTRTLSGSVAVDKVCQSSAASGLAVAAAVGFGAVMVGTFGPNHNFTAFGPDMNNTARLQGLAGFSETLVMEKAYQILKAAKDQLLTDYDWGEIMAKPVKNVSEPLQYRRVSLKQGQGSDGRSRSDTGFKS